MVDQVWKHVQQGTFISRNTHQEYQDQMTWGQKAADAVARFGGSWLFISICAIILILWVVLNSFILVIYNSHWDPYPYILLNLVLSMMAAVQAPVIMMSQNRQAEKDRLDALHDYEVNLKAEIEIRELHNKVDKLLKYLEERE
jgi:uncharacterized membrane protein